MAGSASAFLAGLDSAFFAAFSALRLSLGVSLSVPGTISLPALSMYSCCPLRELLVSSMALRFALLAAWDSLLACLAAAFFSFAFALASACFCF